MLKSYASNQQPTKKKYKLKCKSNSHFPHADTRFHKESFSM